MSSMEFDLREWDRWLSSADLLPVLKKGIHAGSLRSQVLMERKAASAPPASKHGSPGAFNTGAYARAWKSTKMPWGTLLHNSKPYSPVIESGARYTDKAPPTKPLAKWAQRKLGMSKDYAESIAYVMAQNIKKRGLRPRNVLKDARSEIKILVLKEIKFEVDRFFAGGTP